MPSSNTATFEEFLSDTDITLQPLCTALRDTIAEVHRAFTEVIWRRQRIASYGIGPKKQSQHYAYIAPYAAHVNLGFYRGAFLNDPRGLLLGKGLRLRHVKIVDAETACSEDIKQLLRQAISERLAARG